MNDHMDHMLNHDADETYTNPIPESSANISLLKPKSASNNVHLI